MIARITAVCASGPAREAASIAARPSSLELAAASASSPTCRSSSVMSQCRQTNSGVLPAPSFSGQACTSCTSPPSTSTPVSRTFVHCVRLRIPSRNRATSSFSSVCSDTNCP